MTTEKKPVAKKNPLKKPVKTKSVPMAKVVADNKKGVVYPKVRLLSDSMLTTVDKRTVTASGVFLADKKGNILTKQLVVAAGPHCPAKVGEYVEINVDSFKLAATAAQHGIGPDTTKPIIPFEEVEEEIYMFLSARQIKYIYDSSVKDPK